MSATLDQPTALPEFATYAYSYPHKSAYTRLSPALPLSKIWESEARSQLSLYVHLPFCEMRCGFCNLFTQSQPAADQVNNYLRTLATQMSVVADQIPNLHFSQFAIGGGTPTYLAVTQLETLFEQLSFRLNLDFQQTPTSIETSPATITADRLQLLKDYHIRRVSIGIQSFDKQAAGQLGRPQQANTVQRALELLSSYEFPVFNIDLIYGHPEQSLSTWLADIQHALQYEPNELYLYPLYIRPDTGIAQHFAYEQQHRFDLYQAGRELLLSQGYHQLSLRAFQKPTAVHHSTYACQRDGMIGLGCGARSYTQELHYATRYAVTQAGIQALLAEWTQQATAELALATHGFRLSREEQFRRYLILSLLPVEGLLLKELQARYPEYDYRDLAGIKQLFERNWIQVHGERLQLTEAGLQYSDYVAPLLYSTEVLDKLQAFVQFPVPRELNR